MSAARLQTAPPAGGAANRLEAAVALSIAGVAVGSGVAVRLVSGTWQLPGGDDWSYAKAAFTLARTGELRLSGWGVMSLVGQLYLAQPWLALFGRSHGTLHLATSAFGVVALACTYALARRLMERLPAALATVGIAALPGLVPLSVSFETDVPAYALSVLALLVGARAVERHHPGLLLTSVAIGLVGGSIREVALAAPAAVLLTALGGGLREPSRARLAGVFVVGVLSAAVVGAFLLWRPGLPGSQSLPHTLSLRNAAGSGVSIGFTLALYLSPILPLLPWRSLAGGQRWRSAAVAGSTAVFGILAISRGHPLLLPSAVPWARAGPAVMSLGVEPTLAPGSVALLQVLALLAAAAFAALVAASLGGGPRRVADVADQPPVVLLLWVFGVLAALGAVAHAFVGGPVFDRYLFPVALPVVVLMLRGCRPSRLRLAGTGVALGLAVGVGTAASLLGATAQAARYELAMRAVAEGLPPTAVDGGFEWVADHSPDPAFTAAASGWAHPSPWYAEVFPASSNCQLVSQGSLADPNLELIERRRYAALPGLDREVLRYRNPSACAD